MMVNRYVLHYYTHYLSSDTDSRESQKKVLDTELFKYALWFMAKKAQARELMNLIILFINPDIKLISLVSLILTYGRSACKLACPT